MPLFGASRPTQEPRLHVTHALDLERTPLLEHERITQQPASAFRHLHASGDTMGFHPTCGVHRVTPHIVQVPALADDSGDHRSGGDADAHLESGSATLVGLLSLYLTPSV